MDLPVGLERAGATPRDYAQTRCRNRCELHSDPMRID